MTVEYTVYARNRALLEAFIKKLRAFIAANHDLFASARMLNAKFPIKYKKTEMNK